MGRPYPRPWKTTTGRRDMLTDRLWNYCNVLRDESVEDSDNLPDPDMLVREIMEELKAGRA